MAFSVKIIDIKVLSHNVRQYRVERPEGYQFVAGQATEVALDHDEWRHQKRPFTFTGLADAPYLEFVIKSYVSHNGVTNALSLVEVGDGLILDEAWETVPFKGAGNFIAGGAGITPFLAVLRQLSVEGKTAGNRLIFSNHAARDFFLLDEFRAMDGLELLLTSTGDDAPEFLHEMVNRQFLEKHIGRFDGLFYLCGPDKMTADIRGALAELGTSPENIIIAG